MYKFRVFSLVLLAITFAANVVLAAPTLVGSYLLLQDDDGTTPQAETQIVLTFSADGSVTLTATQKTISFQDKGTWSLQGDRLMLELPELGVSLNKAVYSFQNKELVLPFRAFSEEPGTSRWKRTAVLKPFAKDKNSPTTPAVAPIAPLAPVVPATPVVTPLEPLSSTSKDMIAPTPQPTQPLEVLAPFRSQPKIAESIPSSTQPLVAPKNTTPLSQPIQSNKTEISATPKVEIPTAVGSYEAQAVGAEVRFRKAGSFALIARHYAKFSFTIDEKGNVKGKGTVTYALDTDDKGQGEEAGDIANFAESFKEGEPLVRYKASLEGETITRELSVEGKYDPAKGTLSFLLTSPLGTLSYVYDSNGKQTKREFPAWSPFLPEMLGNFSADSLGKVHFSADNSGKNRRDKWQEYRFLWKAEKVEGR